MPSTGPPRRPVVHNLLAGHGAAPPSPARLDRMSPPALVPPELAIAPFLGRVAVDRGLLTARQLQSTAWRRLMRGVYVHESVEITSAVRLDAARLVMPKDAVACGLLAAWLHGAWRPAPGRVVPLDLTRPVLSSGTGFAGLNRRRLTLRGTPDWGGGLVGHSEIDGDVVERDGVLLTSPLRTCFDLMRERRLVEAVVVADAFLWEIGLSRVLLAIYVADRRRWPGVRLVRIAVDLCRENVWSPGETRLRMIYVLAGLPEPWVNVPVLDADGVVIGIPDLRIPGHPVGSEYDGGYHDEDDQPSLDRRRQNRLTTMGSIQLLRYDRISVRDERRTVLDDLRHLTGLRAPVLLDDADFWRPRAARAW